MSVQHAYAEIEASLSAIIQPGTVFELRLLGGEGRKRVDSGYFDSPAAAATALAGLENHYQGVYFTPNPVKSDLLARSYNRIKAFAQVQTHDPEVTRRLWLLIDVDPIRPNGISSTNDEHRAAIRKARQISGMLELEYGWCEPMLNSSGNGAHIMYPMSEPNTEEVRDGVALFLKCLDARFSDERCKVDTTVFNAARIWRVPGTWARKGDNIPTRPHRKAEIVEQVRHADIITFEQVQLFTQQNNYLLSDRDRRRSGVQTTGTSTGPVATNDGHTTQKGPTNERKYQTINNHAMRRLHEWVPLYFPSAREYKEGFRISSTDLGRELEEDLTIHPWPLGIKDFGVADEGDATEGRRTPVSVLADFVTHGDWAEAAKLLAAALDAPVTEFDDLPYAPAGDDLDDLPGAGEGGKRPFNFAAVRSMADLQKRTFKDQKFVIPGVLPTGNMLLAARPKMRKTWLALQLGICISAGRKFLDWQCLQGDVLFLGLEDNERRLRSRINTLLMYEFDLPDLSGFRYWTGGMSENAKGELVVSDPEEAARTYSVFPRGEAGVDAMESYLEMYPKTSMIVIDTLAHFREHSNNRDIYQRDYDSMMPLTKLAARKQVLIVPVHHEKKGLAGQDTGDFLEDVTGSAGITGGADGVISIKGRRGVQDENESRKLYITGRDVPHDYEADMSFDAERGGWLTAARQDVRVALRALFERHPFINQVEMGALLPSVPFARLRKVLTEMKFEGEIKQDKHGYSRAQ